MPVRPLEMSRKSKELQANYYREGLEAPSRGQKVSWCTGISPTEHLRAMDVFPIFPENHAAACGAKRLTPELSDVAEGYGFSRDLCSYFRSDCGSAITGTSPVGGLPRPDMVLSCNNTCNTVTKWYQHLERFFGAPMFLLDSPYVYRKENPDAIAYMANQLEDMKHFVAKVAGRPWDENRFLEVLDLAGQACYYWNQLLELAKAVPSPVTCSDILTVMAPIVVLRGTPECVQFYKEVVAEVRDRVAKGYGAVEGERFRLVWDNIPMWYHLRGLSEKLEQWKAVLVTATYAYGWCLNFDTKRPLESMAESYQAVHLNINTNFKADMIANLVDQYACNGFLIHSNRSCKADAVGAYDISRIVTNRTGVNGLVFEADHTDPRSFAEAQVNGRLDAYFESLGMAMSR